MALAGVLGATPLPAQVSDKTPSQKSVQGQKSDQDQTSNKGKAAAMPSWPTMPTVTLEDSDLQWDPRVRRQVVRIPLPMALLQARPVIGAMEDTPPARLLRDLFVHGKAAGLAGVLYDNRDNDHSPLRANLFPQLTAVRYNDRMRNSKFSYGMANRLLFDRITIGNSSTALTRGFAPRSLPRAAMTSQDSAMQAYISYVTNQIYVYPEHRDYDAVDRFPANWPYMFINQGSSREDQPFVLSAAMIIAALRPETRARLEQTGLVAPTVQMIFRRSLTTVRNRETYMSGVAHPPVFAPQSIERTRTISLANSLKPEDIPPLVMLKVESEDFGSAAGLDGRPEQLFDTPSAIARVWRGPQYSHSMVVSAADTTDPNGRELHFTWVLLQGDPAQVHITPLDEAGKRAKITLDWQEPTVVRQQLGKKTDKHLSGRIDIGVFAWNGVNDSAPAFISVSLPSQQKRRYEAGPDGTMRLAEVDYDAVGRGVSFDPVLQWSAPWRDVQAYDAEGKSAGWLRISEHAVTRFDGQGHLSDGRQVAYQNTKVGKDSAVLSMQPVTTDSH